MKRAVSVIIVPLLFAVALPVFAMPDGGNHTGDARDLAYSVAYFDERGETFVNEAGIQFIAYPGEGQNLYDPTLLPGAYFGVYPLYFVGDTMRFAVTVENIGRRTYRNLRVVAINELLNLSGEAGEAFPGESTFEWFVPVLGPGDSVVLEESMDIAPAVGAGIDQTHVLIYHHDQSGEDKANPGNGRLILDDPQAGLWCPVPRVAEGSLQ